MMYIFVTGASRGIGLEITRLGLVKGHHVMAAARNPEKASELMKLKAQYPALEILSLDLFEKKASDIVKEGVSHWPMVDAVVNNAGIYLEDETLEDFEESFLINSIKPLFITRALVDKLKKSQRPLSVQISSQMGSLHDNVSGGSYSYRSSKAALNMLFKGVSIDEKWLISLLIHPGWVKTRMGGEAAPTTPQDSAQGIWKLMESAKLSDSGTFRNYLGETLPW